MMIAQLTYKHFKVTGTWTSFQSPALIINFFFPKMNKGTFYPFFEKTNSTAEVNLPSELDLSDRSDEVNHLSLP